MDQAPPVSDPACEASTTETVALESPCKRPKINDSDDNEVEILSPTRFKLDSIANNAQDNSSQDDDVILTSSNVTNPNIDYPHMRFDCGVCCFITINGSGGNDNSNSDSSSGNEKHCSKCYCYICDTPAANCLYWTTLKISNHSATDSNKETFDKLTSLGGHCNAFNDKAKEYGGKWVALREFVRFKNNPDANSSNETQHTAAVANPYAGTHSAQIRNEILQRLANLPDSSDSNTAERIKSRKEMRIPDVLLENFRNAVSLHAPAQTSDNTSDNKSNTNIHKTAGDIPTLSLSPLHIEGIRIGFPFSKIMKPQRQIMLHIIRALKNSKHVVLESPTGTGKSVAILCSVLAWQRWWIMRGGGSSGQEGENAKVKIIYCSRTHSQVAQMVSSLKSTPYRPRMAILGSRERLCIHKNIKPRIPGAQPITGININNECRLRVRNTEKYRRQKLSNPSSDGPYLDQDPPEVLPGDGSGDTMLEPEEDENNYMSRSKTCPHYRQLTAERVANLAHATFVPNNKVDCCTVGGKKSKYGSHDIEDLVEFGKNPYLLKDVAVYRGNETSYGLSLKGSRGGCTIRSMKEGGPANVGGVLRVGDEILKVNGVDVSNEDANGVAGRIKESTGDVVMFDVNRGGGEEGEGYSPHAACPYYISHMLAKDADLVFAPYNYVLDPQIRQAMGIELTNAVVILDEGHNIESTLRDAGSGRFGEFELCDLLVMLSNYAVTERNQHNMLDAEGEGESLYLCDVAHALLLFVEKLVNKLKESRQAFERNPGAKGAKAVLREYEKFHTSDDAEFEISVHAPTGHGVRGAAVGCLPFFEQLGILQSDLEMLVRYVDGFERFCRGQESESSGERDRISNLTDRLIDLVHKMCSARSRSEHYYSAIVACANGNLDFANGVEMDAIDDGARRWKKKPRAFPLIPPRTAQHPHRPPNPCLHALCKARSPNVLDPIRHGHSCDGSTPKWEAVLNLELLTPGPLFQELADGCRSVVLASGSLAPIPSLCAELNLFSSDTQLQLPSSTSSSTPPTAPQKRLQTQPRPLEADHVVNLDKQLFVTSIGHFTDGSELQVSYRNYSKPEFLEKLGDSIVKAIEGIPYGGVLVFLPSYTVLKKCERLWNPAGNRFNRRSLWSQVEEPDELSVWGRLKALKHHIIVEPSGSNQTEFEEKKQEYMNSVDRNGGCVLFAVYRGKMSEGISFNDNYARGVICIGVPLPNTFSLPVKLKMNYNDEQRTLRHRTDLLPGREWYSQQAYRAIAQALGRCIRHSADYGAIILMDLRHCDEGIPNDGIPNAHKNLPKWMRTTVRNLSMNSAPRNSMFNHGSASKTIHGGYAGLKKELQKFFSDAKPFAESHMQSLALRPTEATRSSSQMSQFTPPPGSSRAPLSISSSSNSSVIRSVQHTQLSAASKSSAGSDEVEVIDRPPPRNVDGVKVVSKQNTLMNAFQRQKENEPAAKGPKIVKRSPTNLKTIFERQMSEKTPTSKTLSEPKAGAVHNIEQNLNTDTKSAQASCNENMSSTQEMCVTTSEFQSALNPTTFSFERSPFAQYAYSPQQAASITADQDQIALPTSSKSNQQEVAQGNNDSDENLCVICEDGRKQVVLLPCKHMCLCKTCADFDKIKECPLCRTEVADSMTVFI